MNKLKDVIVKPLEKSIYLHPLTMEYMHNGKKRQWDFVKTHDSVFIIIYHITKKVLVLVKQFRPPVYFGNIPESDRQGEIDVNKYPAELGITTELCAGIVDKDLTLKEIAAEEVLEECGYKVDPENLEEVASYTSGVGALGSKQNMYYCEIDDSMKVGTGGGVDDELIDVIEMTIPQVKEYIKTPFILSPPTFLFGINWFLHNKTTKDETN